ncbi:MAG: glycoside hydrolase family 2, partial [Bacteroidota bacterium]|nr:glycoside hydrolase family 2 [Bacteroidota bacterium]
MKPTCRTLFFTLLLSIMASGSVCSGNWNRFNNNWKFTKGNPENAQSTNFDDSSWEKVNLPHDWAIKGPFNEQENGSTGKLPWRGEGWYR